MLKNHTYNLMAQIVEEHKSLYRIKNCYHKDAGTCKQCKTFWAKLRKDKEDHIAELVEMLKSHLK